MTSNDALPSLHSPLCPGVQPQASTPPDLHEVSGALHAAPPFRPLHPQPVAHRAPSPPASCEGRWRAMGDGLGFWWRVLGLQGPGGYRHTANPTENPMPTRVSDSTRPL